MQETVEMKYGYVTYANMNEGWLGKMGEPLAKEMARVKEDYKAKGFHMKYWGHCFGVSENIMVVLVSDNDLDSYLRTGVDTPYGNQRTTLAIK